jgi:hypothetical protein
MGRIHFFEIEDYPWCPQFIRDGDTDFLRFFINFTNGFHPMVPRIRAALEKTGTHQIQDLCSGGTGPWLKMVKQFANEEKYPVNVKLSDRFPNIPALSYISELSNKTITFHPESVDARNVPDTLPGFRTMFSAFHHFKPADARAIIADAVKKRSGFAFIDGIYPRTIGVLLVLINIVLVFGSLAFLRPFRLSRLFFSYVIPIIPFVLIFDGIVSAIRVYSPAELAELVKDIPTEDFVIEYGIERFAGLPLGPTYIIGYPKNPQKS